MGNTFILQVFSADLTDLQWMCELYFNAARNGHFAIDSLNPKVRKLAETNIRSIIEKQLMSGNRRAQAMVFENNSERIGYAIVAELEAGKGGTELHIFIVDPKAQGKGFGQKMLSEIISRWHTITDIFMVCFPKSTTMKHMINKAGFVKIDEDDESACVFLLEQDLPKTAQLNTNLAAY